jgi:hypothetical protein
MKSIAQEANSSTDITPKRHLSGCATVLEGPWPSRIWEVSQAVQTFGRTPWDGWSARCKASMYIGQHNTEIRKFEPATSEPERSSPKTSEYSNKHSNSLKYGIFVDQLSYYYNRKGRRRALKFYHEFSQAFLRETTNMNHFQNPHLFKLYLYTTLVTDDLIRVTN